MPSLRRLVVTAVSLAALWASALVSIAPGQAQSPRHRAGVVVQYADQSIDTRCVEFDEPEINGYELLRRSELPLVIAPGSFGVTVCKIGDEGCNYPAQSCFCQCENINATCIYWISFVQVDGAWKYATLGASNTKVKDGDMQAWVWGAGKADGASVSPPAMTIDQVCAATEATATAPATSTSITNPSPTVTPAAAQQAGAETNSNGLLVFAGIFAALSAILFAASRGRNGSQKNTG